MFYLGRLLALVSIATAANVPSTDAEIYHRFQTLPHSRPPILNVTIFEPDNASPGYLFLAPYASLKAQEVTDPAEAFLTGPSIYDNSGQLIWTGSAILQGRDAYDFKVVTVNGQSQLSFIISPNEFHPENAQGVAVRLNNAYETINTILPLFDTPEINIHEYNIINNGSSALILYSDPVLVNETWVQDDGIAEIDLKTGTTLFRWSAVEHVPLNATSFHFPKNGTTAKDRPWDWFHANSIDKNADGDYLLSSRHTSCIYKISGANGTILWKLGGNDNSFSHTANFNFSWQHDARYRFEDASSTIISLFNNAGAESSVGNEETGFWSQALILELNTSATPMTAKIVHKYDRPDHKISMARGNVQILPNDNVFVGWATSGLISEFTQNGTTVLEAKFLSEKMSTYRSYRYNFTGRPNLPPVIKSIVHGNSPDTANTFHHVSWNGATDVHTWRFFGAMSNASSSLLDAFVLLGSVQKTDFETVFMTQGFTAYVYAEAVDADGGLMGRSVPTAAQVPRAWLGSFCTTDGVECGIGDAETNSDDSGAKPAYAIVDDASDGAKVDARLGGWGSWLSSMLGKPVVLGIVFLGVVVGLYLIRRYGRQRNITRYRRIV